MSKKSQKIDLGLVRKSAPSEDPFKPETDPNKRGIAQERYTALDQLEWMTSDALSAQKAVTEQHNSPFQFQQQQVFGQALQNLPKISIQTPPSFK